MAATKHPHSSFLVEYACGGMSIAPTISVTAHLHFCDQCRAEIESLQAVGGELLAEADAVPVGDNLFDSVFDRLDDQPRTDRPCVVSKAYGRHLPDCIQEFLPEDGLCWRKLTRSLRAARISVGEDKCELGLHWIAAGGKTPEHDHRGLEITVVLQGSFSDEDGVYQEGDFLVREPGDIHRPRAARDEECVCLSVLEAPIKLTGVKRIMNVLMGFVPG